MNTPAKTVLTVTATVNAPVEKTWEIFSAPAHITQWNSPSDDWHTPKAENDLRAGGAFSYRMEAKDKSWGFDFGGVYDEVKENELIRYTIGDGRKVEVIFTKQGNATVVTERFEPENQNPIEMQQSGWQAILDSFKKYAESK